MNTSDLQDNVYWSLVQVAIRARHAFAELAEKNYGLTGAQMHALCMIQPEAPSAMNAISCQLGCDASYITGIIDRLAARGYLERKDDPADRRIKMIVLTKSGVELRTRIIKDIFKLESETLKYLSAHERSQLRKMLAKTLS